jgi:hypothetical protein
MTAKKNWNQNRAIVLQIMRHKNKPGLGWNTRTMGTKKQVGSKFPVLEKKKLPPKIALKRPTINNNESGITDFEYSPPTVDTDGQISFTFDGDKISSKIKLEDKEKNIGQWSQNENVVYLDQKIGVGWIRFLGLHEALEGYLQKKYKLPWNPFGHAIAEAVEHRFFIESGRPESEWKSYDKQVRQVAHMNQGGKIGISRINLKRAFELLAEKRKQFSTVI